MFGLRKGRIAIDNKIAPAKYADHKKALRNTVIAVFFGHPASCDSVTHDALRFEMN